MTEDALSFCQQRGQVLKICQTFQQNSDTKWEKIYGKSASVARSAWLQKPLACASSPFDLSLWIDLDCEILANLAPLFTHAFEDLLIAPDRYASFNSGVVLFRKNTPLIERWAQEALTCHHMGDQDLLIELIEKTKARITALDSIYNWPISQGLHPQIMILHWMGEWGKHYLKMHGGLHEQLAELKAMWEDWG